MIRKPSSLHGSQVCLYLNMAFMPVCVFVLHELYPMIERPPRRRQLRSPYSGLTPAGPSVLFCRELVPERELAAAAPGTDALLWLGSLQGASARGSGREGDQGSRR